MIARDTEIPDVKIIEPKVFGDERGFFLETYQEDRYQRFLDLGDLKFVQDNHSRSTQGVLRGLHFQKTKPQGKLVRCVRGEVFDVVVDIRKGSPTYGKWIGEYLTEENKKQLWCPPGLAHGFLVLSGIADFEYKCTDYYDAQDEGCIRWDDVTLAIEWPTIKDGVYELSEKDNNGSSFDYEHK